MALSIQSNNRNKRRKLYSDSASAATQMPWDESQSSETNRLETYMLGFAMANVCFRKLMAHRVISLRRKICPLSDNSGQNPILARDGLSAFDPKRTFAHV
jgi:hypothetical protein